MNQFTITNVRLITKTHVEQNCNICVNDGIITDIYTINKAPVGQVIDGKGKYLSAGFIDIHLHGGGGSDFMDGTLPAFETAMRMHLSHGTTSLVPSTLAATTQELQVVFDLVSFVKTNKSDAANVLPNVLGIHLEGPYISTEMKGAQDEKYIRLPTKEDYMDLYELSKGNILIWTVAPELLGADSFCQDMRDKGIYFSAGHSNAQYGDMIEAVKNGYTMVTHLYSGMSTIVRENGYRKLGLIESGLLLDELCVEVIADGQHLPPELLRLIVKAKGTDRIVLVTDSMRAAGMPDGKYILGSLAKGQEVIVADNIAKMPDGVNFAGSVATADKLMRTMVNSAGVSICDAVKMMTINPAKEIGIYDKKGSVEIGKDADLIIFDDNFNMDMVFVGGNLAN